MAAPAAVCRAEDISNLLSLEHLDVAIPDQQLSTLFSAGCQRPFISRDPTLPRFVQ